VKKISRSDAMYGSILVPDTICLLIIFLAVISANLWRLSPRDPVYVKAVSIYANILNEVNIIGTEYSSLTTTLGSYAIKKTSENPDIAALMTRLLYDAGISSNSVVAINASGSFPGFTLAVLSACAALDLEAYVIVSIGSSTFGANIPGNTIADMLLKDSVRNLGHKVLAITPGGSGDMGLELDAEELERISETMKKHDIPFIRPANLMEAIKLRENLFNIENCDLLINIGGSHASTGANPDLDLLAGIIKPDKNKIYKDSGLVQSFLNLNKPVIQILNVRKLYSVYGLEIDQNGNLLGNTKKLYRKIQRR